MPKLSEMHPDDVQVVSTPGTAQAAPLKASELSPDDFHVVSTPVVADSPSPAARVAGAAKDAYSGLIDFVSGRGAPIGERIPIIGPAGRQLGERFRAGVDYLTQKGDKPYEAIRQGIRAENDEAQAKFAEEHPLLNAARNVAGAAGAFALPIPTGGGIAGAAGRIGGAITGAGTDAILRTEDPDKMAQAATIGGGLQAGIEVIPVAGRILSPLVQKAGTAIEESAPAVAGFANRRAVKAATGQNKTLLKNIERTKGIDEVGQTLLKGEEPVVQFGSSVSTIKDRAAAAADQSWGKVEEIYHAADQAAGGKAIGGAEIADAIRQKAARIEPLPQNEGVIASMEKTAEYFEKKGPMSLAHAQDLKNNFIFKLANPQSHALGTDGNNAIRSAITETMGEAIQRVDPALAKQWAGHMADYGAFAATAGGSADRAVANLSNRFISPSDYAAGIGAGVIKASSNPDVGDGARTLTMAAVSLAHKFVRERGSSMMATSTKGLANVLATGPEKLGSAYGVLENAAREGPGALEGAHLMLMETDPRYRSLIAPDENRTKSNAIQRRIGE